VLGPLSLLVFVFQLLTGALLAFYYQPTAAAAHESVRLIVSEVPLGWFVHQIHSWGSTALLVLILLRLVRLVFDEYYRSPRELLWITSLALVLLAAHADLTGKLLVWSNSSYWTTVRGLETIASIPVFGQLFAFLVGGLDVNDVTLTRFYFLHLALLPILMILFFAISFATVRRVGLTELPRERGGGGTSYRTHLFNLVITLLIVFGVLVSLAVLVPADFKVEADPIQTIPVGPPWYLLAPYAVLELRPGLLPMLVRGLLVLAAWALLFMLPFLVKGRSEPTRSRLLPRLVLIACILGWGALTWLGAAIEGGGP
jgi:quinol-cytochrome oxidoreductase complex cytochrome b subunit